jgi:hypothetical protein
MAYRRVRLRGAFKGETRRLENTEQSYSDLPDDVRERLHREAEAILLLFGTDVESMLEIGNRFNKVKEDLLEHGQWLTWLGVELGNRIHPNTAALYMRAQRFCADYIKKGKKPNFVNLSRTSMYLLSGPDVPEELQHQVLDRSIDGPISYSEVKNLVDVALKPIRDERKAARAAKKAASSRPNKKKKFLKIFLTTEEQRAEFARQIVGCLELDEGLFSKLLTLSKYDYLEIFAIVADRIYGLKPHGSTPPWEQKEATAEQPIGPYFAR